VALTTLAALALGGLPASAAATGAGARDYRILLTSDRDGQSRVYSVRPDGSRLTPLLRSGRALTFVPGLWVSADGATIAYADRHEAIYVFRADGTGLRRLVRKGFIEGFSPDGKLLAISDGNGGIWIVGRDGHGLRRLTSIDDIGDLRGPGPAWSPDGKAVVFATVIDENRLRYGLVVKPLRGSQRVLVRSGSSAESEAAGIDEPAWSPGGRWIAYVNGEDAERRRGLWIVRPDGRSRRRLASGFVGSPVWSPDGRTIAYLAYDDSLKDEPRALWTVGLSGARRQQFAAGGLFEWSPDGTRLAFLVGADVAVVGRDGRGLTKLQLGGLRVDWFTWSPDGRQLLLKAAAAGDPAQIWVVGSDGTGLQRLTSEGNNELVGWTRLAPVPPAAAPVPPSERVLDAASVATGAPVSLLSADGPRVAFVRKATASDCDRVDVWMPGGGSVQRFGGLPAPCGAGSGFLGLALAGSRAAWANGGHGGDACSYTLISAALADSRGVVLAADEGGPCKVEDHYHLQGDGDLLVFNDRQRLVRIGAGSEKCDEHGQVTESICATLRRGADAAPVDSVSGTLIAIRTAGGVIVLDERGTLVHAFPFAPADVYAARLDGGHLIVWRFGGLESYEVATGARVLSRPMPIGHRLADVNGGIAVLLSADTIMLLRLADGRSLTLAPGGGPVLADLEPPGLYYSYTTAGGGRVVFVPRSEVVARLGDSS